MVLQQPIINFVYGAYLQFFRGVAMRAALRVSTKLSSSYDGYYIKFNPALFSRSSNFEDARVLSI